MINIKNMLDNITVKNNARITVPKGTVLINKNGSSKTSKVCPNCGTWISHWKKLSGKDLPKDGDCAVAMCDGKTKNGHLAKIEGCHVIIKGETDNSVYIAPLCESCNHCAEGTNLQLKRDTVLVRANVSETCSKLKVVRYN